MKLQTIIPIKKETRNPISYTSKILLLGSCFSENIGEKLNYFKFQTIQNPFGILFHPKAIKNLISKAINNTIYKEEDLVLNNEIWHSLEAHSKLSSLDKEEVLSNLNSAIATTNSSIKNATHVIITLGTSWVYRFLETDAIVANCHKIPQKKFTKELLSVAEITEDLQSIIALLKLENPKVNIIFTISPVRHLKDGFTENTQSKAHLIAAVNELKEERKNIFYFPSYEIMMDELRDYRFYEEDMIHPNSIAINYIWERFLETWISEDAHKTLHDIASIQKGIAHKPFNEKAIEHQKFLRNLFEKKDKINKEFPFIKF